MNDRLLGVDREPVGWLTVDELQRFTRTLDSLTFEFGRLPMSKAASAAQSLTHLPPEAFTEQAAWDNGLGTQGGG